MLALGSELAARGHAVTLETWRRWQPHVEAAGMSFLAAPEYPVFPTRERPLRPYEAVARAVGETRPALAAVRPDVVVADVLTLPPALSAELEGIPRATLVPHVFPIAPERAAPYGLGARPPRTAPGRMLWSALGSFTGAGLVRGRRELNETRARLGMEPQERLMGGLSDDLVLVATFPQLEYPRRWPDHVHVIGPLLWEPPAAHVEPPPGEGPLVLVAPSTAHDADHRLLRAAVRGLAGEPARVLATWNRRPLAEPLLVGPNTRLVEWLSYARTMGRCALVVCHGGHGTLVRALASGVPVLAVPAAGDMGENAARLDWAGAGARLPWPLLTPATLRLAARRALAEGALAARAADLGAWYAAHDPAAHAADLLEDLALRNARSESKLRGWDSNPQPSG